MAFNWDVCFETNIAVVDQQHRGLVDIINEAAPLLAAKGELMRARLEVLLERLFDYATVHFRTEEALMKAHGLVAEYRDQHQNKHREFVDYLVELRTLVDNDSLDEAGPSLLRFLTSWLSFHILDEDRRMASQIALVEQGNPPEVAARQSRSVSQNDQARAILVGALLDLYAVVGERNRSLHVTNEQLKQVSGQLEAANCGLEQRVEARTAELHVAIKAMERTQNQLLQSEKMAAIGQLAAGVAHEINNPVGFVSSNIGSLKKYVRQLLEIIDAYADVQTVLPPADGRRTRIENARRAADFEYLKTDIVDLLDESENGLSRVRRIIQDLKDFAHVDEADWQEADLNAGLDSTLNVVWSEIKYKAQVVKHYGDLPPVNCVAAQINQVFMNLLVNAAQAIDQQGIITLASGVAGRTVWVEISDTGAGMSGEVRERIFEPFYTTKPVGKGTGLGLSISWEIVVKKHGGTLDVESQPGKGTRFRLTLPVDGVPLAETPVAQSLDRNVA